MSDNVELNGENIIEFNDEETQNEKAEVEDRRQKK